MVSLPCMSSAKEFISSGFSPIEGKTTWASPSNIALVKYWGKYGKQFPQNPSLSFTLSKCVSTTTVAFKPKEKNQDKVSFSFLFEGKKEIAFHPKIESFLKRIALYCPYLFEHHLAISSSNSFPHSSGIASSASSMSALALAIVSMERIVNPTMSLDYFNQKASFLARLGSGSAARSIVGPIMTWGETTSLVDSSQTYGSQLSGKIHPVFKTFQDTILIIDKGQKKVSSTLGHQLMENHPYAATRFAQAHAHFASLLAILSTGEMDDFIALVELEALTLHALMMASNPYFVLMQPNTLAVLNKIWAFRQDTGFPLSFTLDAGANVHLLYPKENKVVILDFIKTELSTYCQDGQYIEDQVGAGAKML